MSVHVGPCQAYSPVVAHGTVNSRLRPGSTSSYKKACRPRCVLTHSVSKRLITPAGNHPPSITHRTLGFFPSQTGRLIVIGDVHGCAVELAELLIKLRYDAGVDKLIFVGDLVNKGPKSRQVIQIAMQAGAQAVRGNHEEVALASYNKISQFKEDLSWVNDLSADEVSFMAEMPFTVSIPSLNVLVVHAGMVPNVPKIHQRWRHLCTMRNIAEMGPAEKNPFKAKYKAFQYSFRVDENPSFMSAWAPLWKGPQHIIFGHDAKRGVQKCTYATGLDSGCVYGGSLTACVIPILPGVEAVSRLPPTTTATFDDLGAQLVSVPARRAYLAM